MTNVHLNSVRGSHGLSDALLEHSPTASFLRKCFRGYVLKKISKKCVNERTE